MCKMDKLLFICLLFFVQQAVCENVIYKLSKEEYARMPPKNHLDSFEHCLVQPGGVYCTAHADVVSDGPSELLDMMRGYSAVNLKHLNYTNLMYGLCLKQRCRSFYSGDDEEALRNASEACLNHTLSAENGLKTRITELNCYFENKSKFEKDWLDWAVVALALVILALSAVGTVYDVNRDQSKPGNAFLTAFSLRVNWNKLTEPPPSEPRLARLNCLHGIRAISSLCVILGHQPMSMMVGVANPQAVEADYDDPVYQIFGQGHLITLSFFIISGFVLTYNYQVYSEKKALTWKMIPKVVFVRWLRFSPVTIVSILIASTWIRFTAGPMWQENIGNELHDCRNYWYNNLLYINNIFNHSQCALQTWYLACDMHLHILGLVVLLLASKGKARWWILGALHATGVIWTGYHIYTKDLDAIMLSSPSSMAKFFMHQDTFNYSYKRTYANLFVYVMGLAFGYVAQDWHRMGLFEKDMTKYRYWYWLLLPAMVFTLALAGFMFFDDEPRASIGFRLVYGPVIRTLFVMFIVGLIAGAMFKVDNVVRGILEWRGWMPISRLSFCMFSTHMAVVRFLGGTKTTLSYWSRSHVTQEYFGIVVLTIQLSCVLYLFVEAPFAALTKLAMAGKSPRPAAVTDAVQNAEVDTKNKED